MKDWSVFLGVSGTKRKHVIIGKDVVETWNEWGAARIPLELIDSITIIISRGQLVKALNEIQALVRKARLRKFTRIDVN